MNNSFNPAEWIRISSASDRTVQITQFNPFKPSLEMELYIPRKTHPRVQKLVQHVLSSKVTVSTEFQIYARGYMDYSDYENNRQTLLNIASGLYENCNKLDKISEEDNELLGEMREEITETFGVAWKQDGNVFKLGI